MKKFLFLISFMLIVIPPYFASHADEVTTTHAAANKQNMTKENHPLAKTTLTILHDTHFHGNFGKADDQENIANYFGLINQIRTEQPNSLMIGSGDDLATSVLSSTFNGNHIVDAFNAGKLDVDTFGNHDFDMGPDQLLSLIPKSKFAWVSANVYDTRTNDVFGKEVGAKAFIIKEVNGVKVGITGLINEEAPSITSMGPDAKVLNPVEVMKKIIPEMKQAGADLIIVSSHLASPDARKLAQNVAGIDLIVGDHAAQVTDLEKINDTLLSFAGDEFKYLGEINLSIENGKIVDYNYKRYLLEQETAKEDFTPDAAVKSVMDQYNSQLDQELNVTIGKTETALDIMKASQRKGETKFGNFVADAIRNETNADVALVNGGGIRADRIFPVGPLTKRDIMDALPFTNFVVKIEVTGAELQAALENAVSEYENGAGRFAQVSGLTYSFNPNLPAGSRIVKSTVGGKPIHKKATYTVATVDFVANGGDGYSMFKDAKVLLDANAGPLLSTTIIDTIKAKGTINPKLDGRITIAAKQTQAKAVKHNQEKSANVYIVKKGDTLFAIGLKYQINWQTLAKYNHLKNPNLILIGQHISIPNKPFK